jgi:hypothetical protein
MMTRYDVLFSLRRSRRTRTTILPESFILEVIPRQSSEQKDKCTLTSWLVEILHIVRNPIPPKGIPERMQANPTQSVLIN